ncbi:unnamed protein product [Rhizoctonia solani]|uniref:F-box domain-containing protein n=1 Tax=Rhizoctonia solani TaxID=456999 RepID=A0A8H3DA31_9AGAM|nr:unnamed protein product [Rhizoctonia solani]
MPVQQWRAARAQLASAIQAFSEASASLDPSDFVTTSTSGRVEHSLDKLDIEEELQGLLAETRRLGDACTWLKVKRNRSPRVVPINRLSEDILMRIFATVIAWDNISCDFILDTPTLRKKPRSVLVLSSVSVAWRYIVVNTSSFWTHLDLDVLDASYLPKHSGLCLAYVKDAPLDLHITCTIFEANESKHTAPPIPQYLIDHTIASLTIESFSQGHATALANAWLANGSAHNLQNLRVSVKRAYMYQRAQSIPIDASGLCNISTLCLSGVGTDWSTIKLSKFTDLDLSNLESGSCPSIEQLQTILMSNPELRILRLSDIPIDIPAESYSKMAAVKIKLPRLQFLGLGHLPWHLMILLFQVLIPGPEFSCFSVACGFADEMIEPLEAFCSHHKIMALSLDMPVHHEQNLAIFVRSLKCLHTLSLSNLKLDTNAFPDILSDRSGAIDPGSTPDFPRIRRLRFCRCTMIASALKSMVVTHPIHWLRMDSCVVLGTHKMPSRLWAGHAASYLSDSLVRWLSNAVQEVHISKPDDPAPQDVPWWLLPV